MRGGVRVVDAIVVLVLVEAIALTALRRATGRGPIARMLLPNLAAGAFLLLALRAAMSGAGWTWIAPALAAAGVCHALDLHARWRMRVDGGR